MLSELMVPDDAAPAPAMPSRHTDIVIDDPPHSSMDAIAQGTREGIELLVNVTAMLIVIVALVALANQLLGFVTAPFGVTLTIEQMLGWVFAPLAWLIGIPWAECAQGRRAARRQDRAQRAHRLPAARRSRRPARCRSARA